MKENYTIMSSKKVKEFFKLITTYYGEVPELFKQLAFVKGKDKIYALTRDVDTIDLGALRINSLGLYIAQIKNDQFRLSIEGSQLIGPGASQNVYELNDEELKQWFQGKDLAISGEYEGFVILKHGNDYVGSGKYKEGNILNFVPKARRLLELH